MKALFYGDEFATVAAEVSGIRYRVSERDATSEPRAATSDRRFDDETIACLLYTSGTTGKPKGVMIPRRQLLWNGYSTALNWGLRDDDVSPIYTPLYHAGGVAAFLIPIFTVGGTIVLHKSFDAAAVWRTIERERCTVVLGVPTTWKLLMGAPDFASVDEQQDRQLAGADGEGREELLVQAGELELRPFEQIGEPVGHRRPEILVFDHVTSLVLR